MVMSAMSASYQASVVHIDARLDWRDNFIGATVRAGYYA
jgi:hypothetical protein